MIMMQNTDENTGAEPVEAAPQEEDTKPESTDNKNYIEFKVPEGYEVPEEAKNGHEFDAVATLKVNEDGNICLVSIDGSPVDAEDESKENPEEEKNETPEEEKSEEGQEDDGMGNSFAERVGNLYEKSKKKGQ